MMMAMKSALLVTALAVCGAAGAQTTTDPSMQSNGMMAAPSTSMSSSPMTKSQMATMKRCQAMSSDMMMKNKKCAAMAKMHPEMMQGGAMNNGS